MAVYRSAGPWWRGGVLMADRLFHKAARQTRQLFPESLSLMFCVSIRRDSSFSLTGLLVGYQYSA